MNLDDHEIGEALRRRLDSVHVPSELPRTYLRRALRRRLLSFGASFAAGVLVVGGILWTSSRITDQRSPAVIGSTPRGEVSSPSTWRPVGEPQFQPVPEGTSGTVRTLLYLTWIQEVAENSSSSSCTVTVLSSSGEALGSANKNVPPPNAAEVADHEPPYDTSVWFEVKISSDELPGALDASCEPSE
jgi:hypothetical protein